MIVPIAIIWKGRQYHFPRKYRGKDLPEAEVKILYATVCPALYARTSALPPRANPFHTKASPRRKR